MPEKVFKGLFYANQTPQAQRPNDVDKKLHTSIQSNEENTQEIKFLDVYSNELTKLAFDIQNGYDVTLNKFAHLLHEIKIKSNSTSDDSGVSSSSSGRLPNGSGNKINQNKKDKFELLSQKFKTPIYNLTRSAISSNQAANATRSSPNLTNKSRKSRKRSAHIAEISIENDDYKESSEKIEIDKNSNELEADDEEKETVLKKKLAKSKKGEADLTGKKEKKKKLTINTESATEKEALSTEQNSEDLNAAEKKSFQMQTYRLLPSQNQ